MLKNVITSVLFVRILAIYSRMLSHLSYFFRGWLAVPPDGTRCGGRIVSNFIGTEIFFLGGITTSSQLSSICMAGELRRSMIRQRDTKYNFFYSFVAAVVSNYRCL
jgi:hypothetical protein